VTSDRVHLVYILECISNIEDLTSAGEKTFEANPHNRAALLYYLQTMAESTQKLSSALKQAQPHVDWAAIGGFRNRLAHGYLNINMTVVWRVVTDEMPQLKQVAAMLLSEFDENGDSETA
jgi:uncharacterized protein with HEPN domain